MNDKTPRPYMKGDPAYVEQRRAGAGFAIILATTVILLVAVTISLFIAMAADKDDEPYVPAGNVNRDPDELVTTTNKPNQNKLYPTVPSRDSYVIGKASDVKEINSTSVTSGYSILVDLASYSSIAEKSADTKIYPASMTKVMTLVIACERITDFSKELTVTQEIADFAAQQGGSGVGLKVGDSYTVEDLLYLISYQSDTIATILIAEHVAGSEEAFVSLMNQKVSELKLTSTKFDNATGLHSENNYTTCREMASIMAYAMDNELAYKIMTSYQGRNYTVGGVECVFYCSWYSARLKDNPKVSGGKILGGKTGYVDESGYTLVSFAEINGKKYINVTVTRSDKNGIKLQEGPAGQEVKYIYNNYVK